VASLTRQREAYRLLSEEEYLAAGSWEEDAATAPPAPSGRRWRRGPIRPPAFAFRAQTRRSRHRVLAGLVCVACFLPLAVVLTLLAFKGLRRDAGDPREASTRGPRRAGDRGAGDDAGTATAVVPRARAGGAGGPRARESRAGGREPQRPAATRAQLRLVAGPPTRGRVTEDRRSLSVPANPSISPARAPRVAVMRATSAEFGFER
jgi:hypothetical protein